MFHKVIHLYTSLKDGDMDFEGQKLATRIMVEGMTYVSILAMAIGAISRRFDLMVRVVTIATIGIGMVSIPSWPMFRRNLLKYQEPLIEEESDEIISEDHSDGSGSEDH